jgi:hypothetical protein
LPASTSEMQRWVKIKSFGMQEGKQAFLFFLLIFHLTPMMLSSRLGKLQQIV